MKYQDCFQLRRFSECKKPILPSIDKEAWHSEIELIIKLNVKLSFDVNGNSEYQQGFTVAKAMVLLTNRRSFVHWLHLVSKRKQNQIANAWLQLDLLQQQAMYLVLL